MYDGLHMCVSINTQVNGLTSLVSVEVDFTVHCSETRNASGHLYYC